MALLFQLTQKVTQGFSAFWSRWPRKVAKLEAEKAWKHVVTPEDEEPIQNALDWQVPMFKQRQAEHIPHAATWIRGRRWEDEPPTRTPSTARPQTPAQRHQQQAVMKIERLIQGGMSAEEAKRTVYRELGWIKE